MNHGGAPVASTAGQKPAVEAAGIFKQFGSTQALRDVDLTLQPGRCLGLVGRNGAGKSTLVSILSGIYPADAGQVRFEGQPAPPLGAPHAWRSRIATVFQHSMVVPDLTVAENVFLGHQPGPGGLVDWRRMREQAQQIMADWGFRLDVGRPSSSLTVEQRQIVEIARALAAGTRCLLLDEPTAALERAAVERLFARVRQLVSSGVAVLYISHHLEEVFEICQDAAVIRDGEIVLTAPIRGLTKEDLIAAMVGRARAGAPAAGSAAAADGTRGAAAGSAAAADGTGRTAAGDAAAADGTGRTGAGDAADRDAAAAGHAPEPLAAAADTGPEATPCLVLEHVSATAPEGSVRDISLEVHPGERVGVTGLLSAGVSTLARVVAGVMPYEAGTVLVDGKPLTSGRRDLAMRAGVGYVPEDRQAEGFVALLGVAENGTMSIVDWLARRLGWLRPRARSAAMAPLARTLSIVSAGLNQPVGELSGGNQQKVTVARSIARKPRLIVAIAPTRGVDVASKALLLAELAAVTEQSGAGLLLASDELSDLDICDRIVVLVRGERFTEFGAPPFDREALIAATEGLAGNDSTQRQQTETDEQGPPA
jgi:simple sugar transport system ATP-binding protein